MKILIGWNYLRESFLTKENLELLESLGEVVYLEDKQTKRIEPEVLREALVDVDVLVCGWAVCRLDEYVLQKANKLKLVAYTAGSVAGVVSDAMYAKGIRIVSGNEGFARVVAEATVAQMMYSLRKFAECDMRVCTWQTNLGDWYTESLWDQRVGIVGYGSTSRNLINMLKLFNAKIKLFSRHMTDEQAAELGVQKASLEEIFSTCRVITLNTAKTPENHHLVNDELLSLMEQDAVLVNTARGDLIDEEALAKHLHSGHIRASLDVFAQEPLPQESPLWTVPASRLHMLPHMAGPTPDQRPACARLVIEDIARFQKGEPLQNEISASRAGKMTR